MKRALVTGISGQDGYYLLDRLIGAEFEVHGLMRAGAEGAKNPEVQVHEGDLSDAKNLDALVRSVKPDVIFNLGGVSSVARSWEQPVTTGLVTGIAVATILQSAWQLQEESGREVRFIQASSSEVFGAARSSPQTEETPMAPINPYGAAKAYAQQMVSIYRNRGMFASSAVLFNHESPRRPPSFVTRKITLGVAKIAVGLEENLHIGNLDVKRDWGWAPDYVDAMYRMSSMKKPDDIVVATGVVHSVRDFVEAAFKAAGINKWESRVVIDPKFVRPADAHETCGNPSKAEEVLGWRPTVSFEDLVSKMVQNDLHEVSDGKVPRC